MSRTDARWKHHKLVLAGLALLPGAISLVVWFHPTAGYARSGILRGADLRSDIIQILWWCTLVFAVVSTAMIAILAPKVRPLLVRYMLAYGAGAGAVLLVLPLIDKFY